MVVYDDSDDDTPRSPALKPIRFKYTPPRSPIPFVPRRRPMTESEPRGQQSRKRNRESREAKARPCQGDTVLIGHLDPNRPDIATKAGQQTLFASDSSSERGDDGDDETGSRMDEDEETNPDGKPSEGIDRRLPKRSQKDASPTPRAADPNGRIVTNGDMEMPDAPAVGPGQEETISRHRPLVADIAEPKLDDARRLSGASSDFLPRPERLSTFPTPLGFEQRPSFSAKRNSPINLLRVTDSTDSIASSPQLRQHMITAPQGPATNLEPPTMGPLNSPRNHDQSLPPIKNVIAMAQDEEVRNQNRPRNTSMSSTTSTLPPPAPPLSGIATSPRFFIPPPTHANASVFSIGRVQTDPTPLPPPNPANIRPLGHASTNPADHAMHSGAAGHAHQSMLTTSSTASTSTAGATPNSTNDGPSTHPTPSDRSSTVPLPMSPEDSTFSASSPTSTTNSTNGPTLYKCTHPGCRALPFQTPYLLNSHRNVHSSDRPYFCPRKDCPRSFPGRGFKRKNEMLRHGLVHDSPGYVCPFCSPEKEHRYPRPDNLQRHVRMHHEDIDQEDIRLREVLGQRRTTGTKNANGLSLELPSDVGDSRMSTTVKGKAVVESVVPGPSPSQRGRRRKGTG